MPDSRQQTLKTRGHANPPHACPYCEAPPAEGKTYLPFNVFVCGTNAVTNWRNLDAQLSHLHRVAGLDLDDFGDERSDMCRWVTQGRAA